MEKSVNFFVAFFVFLLILAATVGVAFVVYKAGTRAVNYFSKVQVEKRFSLASSSVILCQELTTVKNEYSSIVSIKKSKAFAHSYSIVRFNGVIRAGIRDISAAKIDLDEEENSLNIVLPRCEILENAITDIEIFDESQSIFVSVSTSEIMSEIRKSLDETKKSKIESGILHESEVQATKAVQAVLSAAGFKKINIFFEEPILQNFNVPALENFTN